MANLRKTLQMNIIMSENNGVRGQIQYLFKVAH